MNSIKSSIYYKDYTKFQDYIAIVGGLFKIITLFCNFLNHFNSVNSYYLKLIKDFIINNEDNLKDNPQLIRLTSSLFGKRFNDLSNKKLNTKNESSSNLSNQRTSKIKHFYKVNSSLLSKVFPTFFIGKEAKFILDIYKEFINTRINIINILKKLEVIHLYKTNYKKSITNINQMNTPLKLLNKQINNYLGKNLFNDNNLKNN